MTDRKPATNRGMDRRALLRNGLLTGVGATVAGIAVASPAHAGSTRLAATPAVGLQYGWRYCWWCKGLFYGPRQSTSNCPAGGTHDVGDSYNYAVTGDGASGVPDYQGNWRICSKCAGLFYGGRQQISTCPEGGGNHNGAGSYDYALYHGAPRFYLQQDWRYCSKCQGLFYGGGQSTSKCPLGGTHNGAGSYNYQLDYTN